jgi:hypothetical protein
VALLEYALGTGPAAHGWPEDQRWTLARVTALIEQLLRASYTLRPGTQPHRGRLVHLKRSVGNLAPATLDQLGASIRTRLKRGRWPRRPHTPISRAA